MSSFVNVCVLSLFLIGNVYAIEKSPSILFVDVQGWTSLEQPAIGDYMIDKFEQEGSEPFVVNYRPFARGVKEFAAGLHTCLFGGVPEEVERYTGQSVFGSDVVFERYLRVVTSTKKSVISNFDDLMNKTMVSLRGGLITSENLGFDVSKIKEVRYADRRNSVYQMIRAGHADFGVHLTVGTDPAPEGLHYDPNFALMIEKKALNCLQSDPRSPAIINSFNKLFRTGQLSEGYEP